MKPFIYIPSFDGGVSSGYSKKDEIIPGSEIPWKFWDPKFPEMYRHPYFLTTAGHNYKKENYIELFNFPDDMTIFGDSGGYQIVTGKLKWDPKLLPLIMNWLENNSTIAINLDLPPRGTGSSNFMECLDISADNFRYFADNQLGKTEFLNVLHGNGYQTYKLWYDRVKGLPFKGWSIGDATSRLLSVVESTIVLLEGGEFKNPENKWLHYLGVSSILELLVVAQIQKSLSEIGSPVQVTTDSSTPSLQTKFGRYHTGYSLKEMKFSLVDIPRHRDNLDNFRSSAQALPRHSFIDDYIWKAFPLDDLVTFKTVHYAMLVLHNFTVYYDACRAANQVVWLDKSLRDQFLDNKLIKALDYLDESIKSENPYKTYLKFKPQFSDLARMINLDTPKQSVQDFF